MPRDGITDQEFHQRRVARLQRDQQLSQLTASRNAAAAAQNKVINAKNAQRTLQHGGARVGNMSQETQERLIGQASGLPVAKKAVDPAMRQFEDTAAAIASGQTTTDFGIARQGRVLQNDMAQANVRGVNVASDDTEATRDSRVALTQSEARGNDATAQRTEALTPGEVAQLAIGNAAGATRLGALPGQLDQERLARGAELDAARGRNDFASGLATQDRLTLETGKRPAPPPVQQPSFDPAEAGRIFRSGLGHGSRSNSAGAGDDGFPSDSEISGAGREVASLPMPPAKGDLVDGEVYETPRGRAKWNSATDRFELVE